MLRPQWLVDAAAAILREVCPRGDEGADGGAARGRARRLDGAVRARQREAEARHPGDWEQLASSALVSETLLEFFWDDGDHAKRSEYLIQLMKAMSLLCDWSHSGDDDDDDGATTTTAAMTATAATAAAWSTMICTTMTTSPRSVSSSSRRSCRSSSRRPGAARARRRSAARARARASVMAFDFSARLLPTGLFERLICELVAHGPRLLAETAAQAPARRRGSGARRRRPRAGSDAPDIR